MNSLTRAVATTAALALLVPTAAPAKTPEPPKECGALPPAFDGTLFVGDGDTYNGVGYRAPIRVWGMNAPELRDRDKAETVPGMRARAFVADLLAAASNKAACRPIEWDRYCRVVASCTTGNGKDITLETLKAGFAYGFYLWKHADRVDQAVAYSNAEAEARREKRGLWPQWLGEK
jgi:endonuclease YncB( thermonuclease family)